PMDPRPQRTVVGGGAPLGVHGGVARLVVLHSARETHHHSVLLTRSRVTVGRHPSNDLVLTDPRVSAAHLEVERRDEARVLVRDLGTTNGTWLGPHRIVEAELSPGALLRVGDTTLRLEVDDQAHPEQGSERTRFGGLLGISTEMRELFASLERLAPTELAVLVQGEPGSGKEELARALHQHSPRRDKPFVALDASAVPVPIAESLLFGHEVGAFAGADERRAGVFENAAGGTLFIDELGEMPGEVQALVLRAIEARHVARVGGTEMVPVDVRLVSATHRDLRAEIEAGRFREDLFLRLGEARLLMPPLRARSEDVAPLVAHFLAELSTPERPLSIAPDALKSLAARRFPGNVRELRSVVARAASLNESGVLGEADFAGEGFGFRGSAAEREPLDLAGTFADAKSRAIDRFERAYLDALVRRSGGNLSKASRDADVARNHLRALLKKRGLYDSGGG
ncbi:MAG: sigma 54-interacting transcriptional regulator, partial [Polyangiaceae bacterium]